MSVIERLLEIQAEISEIGREHPHTGLTEVWAALNKANDRLIAAEYRKNRADTGE